MDIRGDGGYAIFCGRSESGGYRSMREFSDLETIEALPPRLADVLRGIYPAQEEAPQRETKPLSSSLPERKLSQAIEKAQNGEGRNNSGFWLAQQLRDNGLPQGEASGYMQRYQESVTGLLDGHGNPSPYPWSEAQATLSSVYRDSPREPEGKGSDFSVNVQTKASETVPRAQAASIFDYRYSVEDLMAMPDKGWYLEGLLAARELVMLAGQPGIGKTFLGLDMAASLVLGRRWARRFEFQASSPLRVDYFLGEGVDRANRRIGALMESYGIQPKDLASLAVFGKVPSLNEVGGAFSVEQIARGYGERRLPIPDVIFIDTFARASAGSDENSARDAGKIIAALDFLKDELGCTVIVVHHTGKNGDIRGSSAYMGAFDAVIKAVKEGEGGVLSAEKLKDSGDFGELYYSLLPMGESRCVGWGEAPVPKRTKEDALLELLESSPGVRFTLREIHEAAGGSVSEQTTRNRLRLLEGRNKVRREDSPDRTKPSVWWVEAVQPGFIRVEF